jgi:hypothetical protein
MCNDSVNIDSTFCQCNNSFVFIDALVDYECW